MSNVIWHITVSLDGFIAGPADAMDWVFDYWDSASDTADDVIKSTGSIIMGRGTYEVEDRNRPGIYGGAWTGPYFVLTHERPEVIPDWMTGEFIDEPIENAVARAKTAAARTAVSASRGAAAARSRQRSVAAAWLPPATSRRASA